MNNDNQGTPADGGQGSSNADGQGSPDATPGQGQADDPQAQQNVAGDAGDPKGQGQEPTPAAADGAEPAPPAAGGETPPVVPDQQPVPYWQQRGFKSEEAFISSYDEGRKTITRGSNEVANLKRSVKRYKEYAAGELDTEDIEALISQENQQATQQQEAQRQQESFATKEANLALETFRMKHSDLKLSDGDIFNIVNLATPYQGDDVDARLEFGLTKFQGITQTAKSGMVNKQQDKMNNDANMGSGGTSNGAGKTGPDYKTMSSEEFTKIKQDLANQ